MKVNAKSWHFQFQWKNYRFLASHIGLFRYGSMWDPTERMNLCSYLRGLTLTAILWVILVATSPIWLTLWGVVKLFWVGINSFTGWYEKRPKKPKIMQEAKSSKGPTLRDLAWQYVKAKKQKICPVVEFENSPLYRCPIELILRFYSKADFDQHMQTFHPQPKP